MMGEVTPETCWAIKKHWNNKLYYKFVYIDIKETKLRSPEEWQISSGTPCI
jgi:hypothetical protein